MLFDERIENADVFPVVFVFFDKFVVVGGFLALVVVIVRSAIRV